MSRRGRHFVPFSLFSFQDIVTSVTAVIILITLIMVLELVNRSLDAATAAAVPANASVDAVEIDRTEAEIRRLELRLHHDAQMLNDVASGSPAELRRQINELEAQNQALRREHAGVQRKTADAAKQLEDATAALQGDATSLAELDSLREQSRQAQEQVATMKRENVLLYNATPDPSKHSWLVDITASRLVVLDLETRNETRFDSRFLDPDVSQFMQWTDKLDSGDHHFVLLVRPSGIEKFARLRARLTESGFSMGFDLIGESETVRAGRP